MELIYLALFICSLPSAICDDNKNCSCTTAYVVNGVIILIMALIIFGLIVALFMTRYNKTICGININKKPSYIRQESGAGVTLCNVTSSNNINDQCRNDGSTLTVNSGIVEIGGLTEPETPTRVEEKKMPYIKKPVGPIIPTFQKAQMDKIIEDVLNRKGKSDSVSFRELEAIAKNSPDTKNNSEIKSNSGSLHEIDGHANTEIDESLYGNAITINYMKNIEAKEERKNQRSGVPKIEVHNSEHAKKNFATKSVDTDTNEQEVYDTLPNPVRYTDSSAETDAYIDSLNLYDMPPRRSWEAGEGKNVVLDQDTQYLLPLSKLKIEAEQEKTCYINAKFRD